MHTVRKSIEGNEIMDTALKGCLLTEVSTEKWEPWLAKKCIEKDASVYNSGQRKSIFKIYKYYMFITMCHLTSSFYVQPKWNGPKPFEVELTKSISTSSLKISIQLKIIAQVSRPESFPLFTSPRPINIWTQMCFHDQWTKMNISPLLAVSWIYHYSNLLIAVSNKQNYF